MYYIELLLASLHYHYQHTMYLNNLISDYIIERGLAGADKKIDKIKEFAEFELKKKFDLMPIDAHLWRFMRLHPGNFPTLRLAQFASIIHHSSVIISQLFLSPDVATYRKLFGAQASEYWNTHYTFDKLSAFKRKSLGASSVDLLIINLVAPMLVAYGRWKADVSMVEKAVDLLMKLKPENNIYSRKWSAIGVQVDNAATSQALIELKTQYCEPKKCLNCSIGNELLKGDL